MKKIIVNKDNCIGCGACVAIDDTHFDFDGDGKSIVILQENLDDANLTNAIESCPIAAISISDCDCIDQCEENEEDSCGGCCGHCNGCE